MTCRCPTISAPTDVARNVAVLSGLWFAYSAVRELTIDRAPAAMANARALRGVQQQWGIGVEADLQQLLGSTASFVAANIYYLVHFPVTIAFVVISFWRDRHGTYARFRDALLLATGAALVLQVLYPLAPPRMLPGFIDTAARYGPDPYALSGSDGANQFAAMPSMHVGWAVLVGLGLWSLRGVMLARLAAVVHPLLTALVVVVTANHYVLDVVAGAALALSAWALLSVLRPNRKEISACAQPSPPTTRSPSAPTALQ